MDFLGTPDIGPLLFAGLTAASLVTAFIGVFTGAAGGVILLGIMAMVMPPAALIPVHTVVMLGSGVTRTMIMWRYVMRGTLLPFLLGRGRRRRENIYCAFCVVATGDTRNLHPAGDLDAAARTCRG